MVETSVMKESIIQHLTENNSALVFSFILDVLPTTAPTLPPKPVTHRTVRPEAHKCLQSMVYYGVALRGGWTAGKFTDMGFVSSLQRCVQLCCNDSECQLAMLMSQKCFTIRCYQSEDCQTIPNGHAQIAYVSREGFAPIGEKSCIFLLKPLFKLISHNLNCRSVKTLKNDLFL